MNGRFYSKSRFGAGKSTSMYAQSPLQKLIYVFIIVCIVAALIALAAYLIYLGSLTEIELTTIQTSELFGCTVAEFHERAFDFYKQAGDLREYASVEAYGAGGKSLRLSLPPDACEKLLASDWISSRDVLARISGAELSADFKKLTITAPRNKSKTMLQTYKELIGVVVMRAHFAQLVSGIIERNVSVYVCVVDEDTGEIVQSENRFYRK